ncbi:MAG: rRNA (guanine527-N7)-methyltransferase [Aliidongia sp.]|nr:rRNA (guanine527-N7)-methyltransferase [Aliidongia sp.]
MTPLTVTEFAGLVPVSRETLDRLRLYVDCLGKWTRRINLVAPASMGDVWRRHILDSAQLYRLLPPDSRTLLDFGSGAGLPGLILAIMGLADVHLVESDQRKAVFLRETARATGASVTIHTQRIEAMPVIAADIVTARALARLDLLLKYAARFLVPHSTCYFLKGAGLADELTEARKFWHMEATEFPSLSGASGVIVKLESIRERQA